MIAKNESLETERQVLHSKGFFLAVLVIAIIVGLALIPFTYFPLAVFLVFLYSRLLYKIIKNEYQGLHTLTIGLAIYRLISALVSLYLTDLSVMREDDRITFLIGTGLDVFLSMALFFLYGELKSLQPAVAGNEPPYSKNQRFKAPQTRSQSGLVNTYSAPQTGQYSTQAESFAQSSQATELLIYEKVSEEADSPQLRNKGLWTKLWVESNGDDAKTKLAYLKHRVAQEIARLALNPHGYSSDIAEPSTSFRTAQPHTQSLAESQPPIASSPVSQAKGSVKKLQLNNISKEFPLDFINEAKSMKGSHKVDLFANSLKEDELWLVESALKESPWLVLAKDRDDRNMLTRAVEYGRFDIAQLLLDFGANPFEISRRTGKSAMHVAAQKNLAWF